MRPSHCLRISLKIILNELREKPGARNSERLWGVLLSGKLMAWRSGPLSPGLSQPFNHFIFGTGNSIDTLSLSSLGWMMMH